MCNSAGGIFRKSGVNLPTVTNVTKVQVFREGHIKFGYYEKDTKFEKIFHLKFDVTE